MTNPDQTDAERPWPRPEYDVPSGETPTATCRHCGRPFRRDRALALHLGDAHQGRLDGDEIDRHAAAVEAERDELFFYHAKVVTALGAVYSITVIVYMIAFGTGFI